MTQPIRLCLAFHNHQPIGNFDFVMQQAFEDSYQPFLDVFEQYGDLPIALHTSGSLMDWLNEHQPEYVDRLAKLVNAGRIEIMGGAYYEPILTMIPRRDRIGQILRYTQWLQNRFGCQIGGCWVPERVWEQSLTSDFVAAGIRYTILDDYHFKNAGLDEEQLFGYYVTEDDGNIVHVFPGSERLRYTIPFAAPQETIDYLGQIHARHPNAVVVFGDDGEKFGSWPNTKKHVYEDGWLRQFFDLLTANKEWIQVTTPSEALARTLPIGKVYLPESSYREMTEWSLPTKRQKQFVELTRQFENDPRLEDIRRFVRGGYWRNFKTKYFETNEMYSRMMQISRRLAIARQSDADPKLLDRAERELFRGQCNCSYWHGAFGGVYLPHLRNAVYRHLILADNLLDRALRKSETWIDDEIGDLDFDARQEIQIANNRLVANFAPSRGGHLYELDVRPICHNLLATLTRRQEFYHQMVAQGQHQDEGDVASIHDRVVFKQDGLENRLQIDPHPRKSLVDHFYPNDATLEDVFDGVAPELGDFTNGIYEAKVRRNPERRQLIMRRAGHVEGANITISKGIAVDSNSDTIEIAYRLEDLPLDRTFHFAVEFNFAGMPAGADDRFFHGADGIRLGQLGTKLDLSEAKYLELVDQWLGLGVRLSVDRPSNIWTFPIESVSQSESGFELVHQSVAVLPHWYVQADSNGRWEVTIRMTLDTSRVENDKSERPLATVTA